MLRYTDVNVIDNKTKTDRTMKIISCLFHFTGVVSNGFCCSQFVCVDFKGETVVRVYRSLNLAK